MLHAPRTDTTVHVEKTVGDINMIYLFFDLIDENGNYLVDQSGNYLVADMQGNALVLHAQSTDTTVRA